MSLRWKLYKLRTYIMRNVLKIWEPIKWEEGDAPTLDSKPDFVLDFRGKKCQ